jgi:cellulose synthase/poly-beta-1,6-N-acetylglucosamine synthase-like glycosyltransferase
MSVLESTAWIVVLAAAAFALYTYAGYPAILWIVSRLKPARWSDGGDGIGTDWPSVSISVPAYNEENQIEGLIQSLLALDYPRERLQILIVSDASSDKTDEIVRRYEPQGIQLLRIPERGGKTNAENRAAEELTGDIIVNTDASIRLAPQALKPLISAFHDPSVGLASGRDVSVDSSNIEDNVGESGYVGYEMAIRDLETQVSGIVGASGSFYAIRPEVHRTPLPESLSRDFAAALLTKERGLRAVSINEAICFVPRTSSLKKEYDRKVRTIARGIDTLAYKKNLLNPLRFGTFAWMLASHKVCRWALPWFLLLGLLGLFILSWMHLWALAVFLVVLTVTLLGAVGWMHSNNSHTPPLLGFPAFLLAGNVAAGHALIRFLRGDRAATWEPTRRKPVD